MAIPTDVATRLLQLVRDGELSKAEAIAVAEAVDDGRTLGQRGLDDSELQARLRRRAEEADRNLAERWRMINALTVEDLARGET